MNNFKLSADDVVNEIIDEFNFFDDWEDKYAHIIDMGKKLEKLDQSLIFFPDFALFVIAAKILREIKPSFPLTFGLTFLETTSAK